MSFSIKNIIIIYIVLSIAFGLYSSTKSLYRDFKKPPYTVSNRIKAIVAYLIGLILSPIILFPMAVYFFLISNFDDFKQKTLLSKKFQKFRKKKENPFMDALTKQDYETRIKFIQDWIGRTPSDPVWSLIKQTCEGIKNYEGYVFRDRDSDTPAFDHENYDLVKKCIGALGEAQDERAMRFLIIITTYNRFRDSVNERFIEDGIWALGNFYHRDVISHLKHLVEHAGQYNVISKAKETLSEIKERGKRPKKWKGEITEKYCQP